MSVPAPAGRVLCALTEIADGRAKDLDLGTPEAPLEIFLVRVGPAVYAYHNRCPHTGSPLDWEPDDFLDAAGRYLLCHTHGALFEIADGGCIAGPCVGDRLSPVAVALDADGNVVLAQALAPLD